MAVDAAAPIESSLRPDGLPGVLTGIRPHPHESIRAARGLVRGPASPVGGWSPVAVRVEQRCGANDFENAGNDRQATERW